MDRLSKLAAADGIGPAVLRNAARSSALRLRRLLVVLVMVLATSATSVVQAKAPISPRTLEHWMRAKAILAAGGSPEQALEQLRLGLAYSEAPALVAEKLRLEVKLGRMRPATRAADRLPQQVRQHPWVRASLAALERAKSTKGRRWFPVSNETRCGR